MTSQSSSSEYNYGAADGGREEDGSLVQGAKERVAEGTTAVQERVTSGADKGMDKAAEGLGTAAEKMRSRAAEESGVRSTVQEKAADAMDKTAVYLKEHDSQELMHELEEYVKTHPLQAAAGALVAGFVLAKIVR
jgi:ElaB/YqjD/DUF883 family membrane-anchored ribosome-binding protein